MKFLRFLFRLALFGFFGGLWLLAGIYLYLSPNLPDVETLRDVKLQTPMRVYTRDGQLIGQFGEQKRSPLPFDVIPQQFIDSLLAAEDDNFFQHSGIDLMGLMRAVSELVLTGEKGSGGSTLTMQVARNYFLTLERTFMRKFNEILLAIEIERALDKQEIFELYFNRVFLGHRAYGFQAAAQVYYGKSIEELTLAQHAMLAGIPKAPSRNNPISGPENGLERRDWILGRMLNLGFISSSQFDEALQAPITAKHHDEQLSFSAHYAAEMVRQEMLDRYGIAAYNDGFHVYTTIDSHLQQVARQAVIKGLITYDKRHGYRGPERQMPAAEDGTDARPGWLEALAETAVIADLQPAVITELDEKKVTILLADGSQSEVLWDNGLRQAAPYLSENSVAKRPKSPAELLAVGDLIRVAWQEDEKDEEDAEDGKADKQAEAGEGEDGAEAGTSGAWHLAQVPAAQAALVSLHPDDGAILTVVGGMGFELSKFNRATQALRQPGSNFKPFLYSAALESGFTAASIINDAPIVMEDSSLETMWRPENDGGKFYGPTRLRWALTKSRNLVSIRLLQQLGVDKLIDYAARFGFDTSTFSHDLSLALGTHVVSVLDLAAAYAVLANGGYRVEPYLIERIDDLSGATVFEAMPMTVCRDCEQPTSSQEKSDEIDPAQTLPADDPGKPELPPAPRIMDARVNFIINSILRDVITRGTGRRALVLERSDIAGKTGTTNGPMDAWFSGYNADVVTSTWVGFDGYTPLGRREFGGTAALPIWIDYMREALQESPQQERPIPPGTVSVRIDPETGLLAPPGQPDAIFEYFRQEHVPERDNDNNGASSEAADDLVRDIF